MKVEAIQYGDRKVYSVAAFNRGIASLRGACPASGSRSYATELRRGSWQSVFFLKDRRDAD